MTTPLSKHEQKILAELELQFPEVGTPAVRPSAVPAPEQVSRRYLSRRNVVSGAMADLVGVAMLAIGASLPSIPVGAAGFILMGIGVYLALLPTGTSRREKAKNPGGPEVVEDTPDAVKMADTRQSSFRGGHREKVLRSLTCWL